MNCITRWLKRPHVVEVLRTEHDADAFYWREKGANGEITCTSHPETFTREADAWRAARQHCAARRVLKGK